ncbi:MAG: hypothetical protein JRD04_02950 [Deltaproteobacteria bacterium]|nr:hypothetical protein [Deltaproteobacteria bacterium]
MASRKAAKPQRLKDLLVFCDRKPAGKGLCNARGLVPLLLGMLLLTACAGLPRINAVDAARASKIIKTCENAFSEGKWQFAHVIEANLPGGRDAQLIGVTELSSRPKRIHAVMMTLEGLVLFDGLFDGKLTLNRGVAPFDSIGFAEGLMEDIRFIFLKPDGEPIEAGITEDGFEVCRYRVSNDALVDVMVRPDRILEIRQYANERLIRKVVSELTPGVSPGKITFTAQEPAKYRLNLRLISAEQITN